MSTETSQDVPVALEAYRTITFIIALVTIASWLGVVFSNVTVASATGLLVVCVVLYAIQYAFEAWVG